MYVYIFPLSNNLKFPLYFSNIVAYILRLNCFNIINVHFMKINYYYVCLFECEFAVFETVSCTYI